VDPSQAQPGGRPWVTAPELVTGDAVALDLRLARLPTRMLSFAIDVGVQLGLGVGFGLADALWLDRAAMPLQTAIVLSELVVCLVGYPVVMETLTRGRTLGKLALGLRTVRDDGGSIGFAQAFVRGLAGLIDFWSSAFVVALVVAGASARDKRVGDLLAGTVVVRERTPTRVVGPPVMPPELAGWAQTLQLSVLPDGLVRAGRHYLERLAQFDPAFAAERGLALASAVAAVTAPPPPPGVPPVRYLQAVLAERHRRSMAGLASRFPSPPPAVVVGDPSPVVLPGPARPGPALPGPPTVAPTGFAPPH
jgi:uncharacterized RDD family membrane protein YckC